MIESSKSVVGLLVVMALACAAPTVLASDSDASVRAACADLVLDYAYYRDRYDATAVSELFTEDAVLKVFDDEFKGKQAIYDRLAMAEAPPVIRHQMSTIRIFLPDKKSPEPIKQASGVSYVTVYTAPAATLPASTKRFASIGEYHDEFVLTAAGWKISKRTYIPVFAPE